MGRDAKVCFDTLVREEEPSDLVYFYYHEQCIWAYDRSKKIFMSFADAENFRDSY